MLRLTVALMLLASPAWAAGVIDSPGIPYGGNGTSLTVIPQGGSAPVGLGSVAGLTVGAVQLGGDVGTNTVVPARGSGIPRSLSALTGEVWSAVSFGLVCDGTADQVKVITTLNAAPPGQTIYFPPAALPCMTSVPLSPTSGVTVKADPGTVTIMAVPGGSLNGPELLSVVNATGVRVSGLIFDGNLVNQPGQLTISGSLVSNKPNTLQVYGSTDVVLDGIRVQNTRGIGVLLSNSNNSGVRDTVLSNVGNYSNSLDISQLSQGVAFTSDGSMEMGNFVERNTFSQVGLDPISFAYQKDIRVADNTIVATAFQTQTAVISGGIYGTQNIAPIVTGNRISGARGSGIDIGAMNGATISRNVLWNNGGCGIFVTQGTINTLVSANVAYNNGQAGLATAAAGIMFGSPPSGSFPASDRNDVIGNKTFDTQAVKTQLYGFQVTGAGAVTNLWVDSSNNFDGNALGRFSGTGAAYSTNR